MKTVTILIVASIILFTYFIIKSIRPTSLVRQRFPPLLQNATCVMNEKNISTLTPVSLHGRVDQVFLLLDGRHVVIDTKVRETKKVYPSDIIQVSVYSIILKYMGYKVCPFAFIRFPDGGDRSSYKKVRLYTESHIVSLHRRYISIKNGSIKVSCTCGKHKNTPS